MKKNILFHLKKILHSIGDTSHLTEVYLTYLCKSNSQINSLNKYLIIFSSITFILLSNNLAYSQITIDGNPSEWPAVLNNAANTKKAFKHDPFNANGIDDQWTQGSKDTDASPAANWKWINGNSNDKGDIGNAGAVLLGTKLYFFGDRAAFNGDAQIGFWFFLNDVTPIGNGVSVSSFQGEHANGDLLIISNFTNGGGNTQPTVYKWAGKTANNPGGLVQVAANSVSATLASNSQAYNVPGGASGTSMFNGDTWIFSPKSGLANTYPVPLFFEGSVDLATIQGISPCFKRFLLETRNSQSLTASLQDLAAGGFSGVPPAPSAVANSRCGAGSVTLNASGCTGTLNWYANASGGLSLGTGPTYNTPTISQTTTYYVSCTTDGCEGSRTPVIATINPPPTAGATFTPIICYGGNSTISVSASGGTPPYTYSLDDLTYQAGNTFSVPSGSYTVYVKDFKGCKGQYQVLINQPDPSQLNILKDGLEYSIQCELGADGANAALQAAYSAWLAIPPTVTGATGTPIVSNDPIDLSGLSLSGGTVTVTWHVVDACGNDQVTASFVISSGCTITCNSTPTPTLCNGSSDGSVATAVSGGLYPYTFYLYLDTNPDPNINELVDTGLTMNLNSESGSVTFSNLAAGHYVIRIIDTVQTLDNATECDAVVTQPTAVSCSIQSDNPDCFGGNDGSLTATGAGGTGAYSYSLNGGAPQASGTFSGLVANVLYTVTVKDVNNCSSTCSVTLTQPTAVSCSIQSDNPDCFGGNDGSLTATGAGGTGAYSYSLNGGAPQASGTFSGLVANVLYTVTVKDVNNCSSTCSVTLTQPTAVSCSIQSDNPDCFGGNDGSLTATGAGGTGAYSYSLNGGAPQASGTFSGLVANVLYTVTVKDVNNCSSTCTVTLTQPTALSCSIQSDNPDCSNGNDGSLTASGSGGTGAYSYSLNGGAPQASGTFSGLLANVLYTVTVKDVNNCSSTCSVTLTQPSGISCSIQSDNPDCFGGNDGSLTASGAGGTGAYTYSLNGGAPQASGTFSGLVANVLYTVTVKDVNNCSSTCSVTLTQPTAVSCSIQSDNPDCFGGNDGSLTATGAGGTGAYSYSLNGGAPQASGTFSGLVANVLYTVTVKDVNNCSSTCSVTLTQPTAVSCSIQSDNPDCFGGNDGSLTATGAGGTGAYSYSLNGGAPQASGTFSGLVANVLYTVTVKDVNNCSSTCSVTLTQPPAISCSIQSDNPDCFGGNDGSLTATGAGGNGAYSYSLNGGAPQASGTFSGLVANVLYTVTVKDINNCSSTCSVTLTQPAALSCSLTQPATAACATSGNTVSGTVSGGSSPYSISASFDSAGITAGWSASGIIVGNVITVTYTAGGVASTVLTVVVTDANGCEHSCDVRLTCDGGKACTPGFWKNHKEVWDSQNDYTVNNMPGALPSTPGGTFISTTNFFTYFAISPSSAISTSASLTMLAATNLGGGDCKALARHGVSALLGAAAFPDDYPFAAAGVDNFQQLYNLIRNAFVSGNCSSLATILGNINNLDGPFCSALSKLPEQSIQAVYNQVESPMFSVYPVPFKDNFTILYEFDYKTDVLIQVFDIRGQLLLSTTDKDAYKGKEMKIDFPLTHQKGELFFIRVETNKEHSIRNISSSTN